MDANIFNNTDNELQVGLQKHYSQGLLVSAEYANSRALGTETSESPLTFSDSYGNLNSLRRHVFELAYVYDLPVGSGKRWLTNVRGAAGKLASGWQVSGITGIMSGQPFSVTFNAAKQGWFSSRANLVPGVPLYAADRTVKQWFNPAAFSIPAPFTFGNTAYNMLWGPGLQNWDISLSKSTRFGERVNLQFRIDAFNSFNHPNFANPNANVSSPGVVGTITSLCSICEPRTVQLAAKLIF